MAAIIISTLIITVLVSPLRWRIQKNVDRRFFGKKYDAEEVMAAFSAGLCHKMHLDDLQNQIVAVVQDTLQPEQVSVWRKTQGRKSGR